MLKLRSIKRLNPGCVTRVFVFALGAIASTSAAAQDSASTGAPKDKVYANAYVARNVVVSTRDGTPLATDVYRPGEDGHVVSGPLPTLVDRTPYGKSYYQSAGIFFARHGYAVVIQDVRGLNKSHGKFYPSQFS